MVHSNGMLGLVRFRMRARRNLEILDRALGFEEIALRCEARDAYECHTGIFAFYSPLASMGVIAPLSWVDAQTPRPVHLVRACTPRTGSAALHYR